MAILPEISGPQDVKRLSPEECRQLATELRQTIIDTVSRQGGHLASNLGDVELILALHRAFDSPRDKLVFDVGHQTYAHKLLTGRQEQFSTLRSYHGMSGFPAMRRASTTCSIQGTPPRRSPWRWGWRARAISGTRTITSWRLWATAR